MTERLTTETHVVLVAYHGQRWLDTCLASLQAASRADTLLTVVDNAGEHDFSQLPAAPFHNEIVKTPRPMGFAEANNFALAKVSNHSFATCLLNQDTIGQPDWLDTCLEYLHTHPDVGAVTPVLRTYDGQGWDPGFLEILPQEFRQKMTREGVRVHDFIETETVTAAAMLIRTDVLRSVGPFDPIYGSYYEDFDLCARVRRAGYRVGICTAAEVWHFSGSATQTVEQRIRRSRQIIRNKAIHNVRHGAGNRLSRISRCLLANLPQRFIRSLLRTATSQPLSAVAGASADLLWLLPRLCSRSRDEQQWEVYLASLPWSRENATASTKRDPNTSAR